MTSNWPPAATEGGGQSRDQGQAGGGQPKPEEVGSESNGAKHHIKIEEEIKVIAADNAKKVGFSPPSIPPPSTQPKTINNLLSAVAFEIS